MPGGRTAEAAERAHDKAHLRLQPIDAGGDEEHDPWAGWEDPHLPPHPKVGVDDLARELRRVVRRGLPLTQRTAGTVLSNLRSVIARSIHPYDGQSRVDSLNQLLVRTLVGLGQEPEGEAARVLFAVTAGTRGTTLTVRRERCAEVLSYDVDHFRKHIEPKLIEDMATLIYRDLLRYKRRIRRAPLSEEPTGDTPSITEQDFTHQEELVSRIWQRVYGWRAELIAVGRLSGQRGYESQAEDHRQAAEREEAALRRLLNEYVETYGEELVRHGEAEYAVEGLTRLIKIE
jgi:hypothetical protein